MKFEFNEVYLENFLVQTFSLWSWREAGIKNIHLRYFIDIIVTVLVLAIALSVNSPPFIVCVSVSDELADLICAEESLQLMMDAAEALPGFQQTKDSDKILKKIVDSLVLYTSNGKHSLWV